MPLTQGTNLSRQGALNKSAPIERQCAHNTVITTNHRANWGRRLTRKHKSTSLDLFCHSCFWSHRWATQTLNYNWDRAYVNDTEITITRCSAYTGVESHDGEHSTLVYRSLKTCTLNTGIPISQEMVHFTHRDNNLTRQGAIFRSTKRCGARGGVVVKALRYKPAGRGFVSRWCHWNFSVT
jgi:hypothetical protein